MIKRCVVAPSIVAGSLLFAMPALANCPALPHTMTNGQVADATQLMANLEALRACVNSLVAGSTNSVQVNAGSGDLTGVGPLTNGQLVVGSTGNAPQAAAITAGPGISVTNAPGSITIAGTGAGDIYREFGAFAPPIASSFTYIDNAGSVTPSVADITNIGLVYSVNVTNSTNAFAGAYRNAPALSAWTWTVRAKYSTPNGSWPEFGLWIKDTSGKMVGLVSESGGFIIKRLNSNTSHNSNPFYSDYVDAPNWFRVQYDGTNLNFYFSWDSQNWLYVWQEPKSGFLNGTLQYIGIGGLHDINETSRWKAGSKTGAVVTYWDIDDDPASARTH